MFRFISVQIISATIQQHQEQTETFFKIGYAFVGPSLHILMLLAVVYFSNESLAYVWEIQEEVKQKVIYDLLQTGYLPSRRVLLVLSFPLAQLLTTTLIEMENGKMLLYGGIEKIYTRMWRSCKGKTKVGIAPARLRLEACSLHNVIYWHSYSPKMSFSFTCNEKNIYKKCGIIGWRRWRFYQSIHSNFIAKLGIK